MIFLGAICELMVDCLFWSWKIETKECCAKFDDSIVEANDKFISGDLIWDADDPFPIL